MPRELTIDEQQRRDHWRRVHEEGDRRRPIALPERPRGRVMGTGLRFERGGLWND